VNEVFKRSGQNGVHPLNMCCVFGLAVLWWRNNCCSWDYNEL